MYKICFQACFFRFHVISNRFSSDGLSDLRRAIFRFQPNDFHLLGLTEQEARICTQKRPEFLFFGALVGYGCPVFNFFLCCGFFFLLPI